MHIGDIHSEVWIEQWTEEYLRVFSQEKQRIAAAIDERRLKA